MKFRDMLLLGLVFGVAVLFVCLTHPANPAHVLVASDIQKDSARFSPYESVDVGMAMKILTHDAPRVGVMPTPVPTLLLFPPSSEDLAKLSG